jgi:N-hydroxyarylamine O-acetyltransferase
MTGPLPTQIGQWGGELLDVATYSERIRCKVDGSPSSDTLRALHRAHVLTIPFENVDVVLGRPPRLDVESLQDKLVRRARGGYCYEHTLLFAALLERLGYTVTGLAGRVRNGNDARRPRSHAALRVEADGQWWLADVGFGAERLLEPLPMVDGTVRRQGSWTFRVDVLGDGEWMLRSRRPDGWFNLYSMDLATHLPADYAVQNHYTATHPDSPFVSRLVAQRTTADARYTLRDTELRITGAHGGIEQREVADDELIDVLRDTFGIELAEDESAALAARL